VLPFFKHLKGMKTMAARRKREEEAEFLKLNTTSNPTELDILTFALHLLRRV